ncbi:glycosyltransferase [Apibacter muscae]|uniref:glycosyltransferase family 2 protein n=1 Tax=Apibacter muscae TaxID=2509004 RepID=UPI0011ABF136|nr:glycosyltransferase [Apibacter muscae]TWP31195.1 glycosyltransferase [Apibacter muscae]
MNQPLVSIVAINYNNEKYVIETLDSIANQTYQNTELIIVDDCSTDESLHIIEKWLKNYNKPYKLIKHAKNLGVCKTINDGYGIAKGKYISSIATDDIMLSKKIEKQVCCLENTDNTVGMVYSNAYLIDDNSNVIEGNFIAKYRGDLSNPFTGNVYQELFKGNFIPAMSIMIKKNILLDIGYFDERLKYEDFDMWLRIAEKYKIIYSEYISVKYRIRENSLSNRISKIEWILDNIRIYKKHKNRDIILRKEYNIIRKKWYLRLSEEKLPFIDKIKFVFNIGVGSGSRRSLLKFLFS